MSWFYNIKEEQNSGDIFSHLYVTLREKQVVQERRKKVIIISGPTGVGKTKMSIEIAKALEGEIISVDSMQIYRGMDIGTDKVSQEERQKIPHHMIDIVDLSDPFNVVDFYNRAHIICRDIILRDKVPIIVGGSGFYIHAFLYGPPQGPPSVSGIRKEIEQEMEKNGVKALFQKLQKLDFKYASTITENDKHKIVRALEIIEITKMPVSDFPKPEIIESGLYDWCCWFLHMPKEILYARVEERCEQMIKKGFIEEVEKLKQQGLTGNFTASQAIGYRQCLEFLNTDRSDEERQKFIDSFKKATKHYIKRQFTWFKREPLFRWLDLYEVNFNLAMEFILQDFEQG